MRDAMYSADPAPDRLEAAGRRSCRLRAVRPPCSRKAWPLVEEAASYLDGPGRIDSRKLNRELALVYAAESMEVTTRLMQAASWLVVQRAVREKDMRVEEAGDVEISHFQAGRTASGGSRHDAARQAYGRRLIVRGGTATTRLPAVRWRGASSGDRPEPAEESHATEANRSSAPRSRRRHLRSAVGSLAW